MAHDRPQIVLITGCSSGGIGHALALAFAKQHCTVIATARSLASLRDLEDVPNVQTLQLDVTSEESRNQAVAAVMDRHGRIDILVNNAGMHCIGPVAELPIALLDKAFTTNVYAPISLIQAVIPQMIARRKGKIVNMGSVAAFAPSPWSGGYSASKAAIHALSDSLRVELKPFGIHVITVAGGAIKSNLEVNATKIYESLPQWKFYRPWEESIRKRMGYSQQTLSTTSEEFAAKTARAVLKTNPPPCFTFGYLSGRLSIAYFLPLWMRDYLYMKMFGLDKHQNLEKSD